MIRFERVSKVFGTVTAVDSVDMEVPAGAVCVLLGPSGCGKTTTMKMINRLIAPSSGKIFINGADTAGVDEVTLRRSIGYVIQQIGLFPNKTVEDNICVVPDLLGWERGKSRKRAAELLEMVNLPPATFLKRYPKELSGGQQRRVGVVRALAAYPTVLLTDERIGTRAPINREVIRTIHQAAGRAEEDHRVRQPRHRRGGEDGLAHRDLPRRPPHQYDTPTTCWPTGQRLRRRLRRRRPTLKAPAPDQGRRTP